MKEDNIRNHYKITLKKDCDYEKFLNTSMRLFDKVYSIFVNKNYYEGKLISYIVNITQFSEDKYNTIKIDDCIINEILYAIMTSTNDYNIYFKQPTLEIMYEVYYNYTCKLSADIVHKFPEYEYDNVLQTCALVMCNLYNKGYYLNKKIIKTSLLHEIYMMHNKRLKEPHCIDSSIFINLEKDDVNDWFNNLEDKRASKRQEEDEHNDVINSIMIILDPIIKNEIGERRFKRLLDSYTKRCVTSSSQVDIRAIRKILSKLGYDLDWFRRQFE